MKLHLTINVPNWLDRICAWPVLFYRRLKYGYTYRRIFLGEGEWTIVEPEDYYRFRDFRWCVSGNGTSYYAVRNAKTGPFRTKMVSLHRGIMNPPDGLLVDHRNRDSLDNRRVNLRIATQSQNMQNRRKKPNASSRFIGVCFKKNEYLWVAQIKYKKKRLWLGRFDNEVDAAKAYDRAAKQYHGEFARLNFSERGAGPPSA
jgi:hypothetical protein